MRGQMSANYTGSDEQAVQDYLLYHLAIETNSQRVVVGSIKQVFFVGTAAYVTAQDDDGVVRGGSDVTATTPVSVLPLVVAIPAALVLMLGLAAYFHRRRQEPSVRREVMDHHDAEDSMTSSLVPATEGKPPAEPILLVPTISQSCSMDSTVEAQFLPQDLENGPRLMPMENNVEVPSQDEQPVDQPVSTNNTLPDYRAFNEAVDRMNAAARAASQTPLETATTERETIAAAGTRSESPNLLLDLDEDFAAETTPTDGPIVMLDNLPPLPPGGPCDITIRLGEAVNNTVVFLLFRRTNRGGEFTG